MVEQNFKVSFFLNESELTYFRLFLYANSKSSNVPKILLEDMCPVARAIGCQLNFKGGQNETQKEV